MVKGLCYICIYVFFFFCVCVCVVVVVAVGFFVCLSSPSLHPPKTTGLGMVAYGLARSGTSFIEFPVA